MTRITAEDRILIKQLRIEKQWGARRMTNEFPNKAWSIASVSRAINKIDNNSTTERKPGSGRPRSARTQQNIERVSELICSQDNDPHSHKSPREIQRETGISRSSVQRIVKQDLQLKTYKRMIGQKLNESVKLKRLQRSRQLLERFPNERSVRSIWFTDEKIFTIATPVNSQNDRVYSIETKKSRIPESRLLRERDHFSRGIMVSVGVSRIGKTSVVFVEPGAKVNSGYYCDHVLRQGLLPVIQATSGRHNWTLQQDGAPSHTARNTINFLHQENINFIEPDMWPPNSPDLNPVDYAIWGVLQEKVYLRRKFTTVEQLKLAITVEWRNLGQRFIDRSINEWRRRLEKVVEKQGGHIEHDF
jgi:AraC-like DNA-binding protein